MSDEPGQIQPAPTGIIAALAAFKAEAPKLPKDAEGQIQSRKYHYTTLDTIDELVQPLLTKHELVWTALPTVLDDEARSPALAYKLLHVSGQSLEGVMKLVGVETMQAHGSAISYARRYAKVAVLDLVADEDDDGKIASQAPTHHRESRAGGTTVDLRDQAKGLSDRQINIARAQAGLDHVEETGNQPWKSLASIPPELSSKLQETLDAVRLAGVSS